VHVQVRLTWASDSFDPRYVTYVWFDALINYSGLKYKAETY